MTGGRAEFRLSVVLVALLAAACSKPDSDGTACQPTKTYGAEVGDWVQNFRLRDQQNQEVHLSDYCGDVVVLQMGAMWCPSCQLEAEGIQALMAEFGNEGFVVITLMAENIEGTSPKPRELGSWATTFDLATPVLADPAWRIWDRYFPERPTPGALLIDRQGRIKVKSYVVSEEQILETL